MQAATACFLRLQLSLIFNFDPDSRVKMSSHLNCEWVTMEKMQGEEYEKKRKSLVDNF